MAIATTNATPAELHIAGNGRLLVDAGRTMSCVVNVVARSDSEVSASFLRRVVVNNVAGVVSLVGSVEMIGSDQKDAGASAWVVAITEDDANDALAVMVTGAVRVYPLACGGAGQ